MNDLMPLPGMEGSLAGGPGRSPAMEGDAVRQRHPPGRTEPGDEGHEAS
jgi:hypothetical protein